jgi:hypothetical protein
MTIIRFNQARGPLSLYQGETRSPQKDQRSDTARPPRVGESQDTNTGSTAFVRTIALASERSLRFAFPPVPARKFYLQRSFELTRNLVFSGSDMFARALPLLLFARLATAAITMSLFRTESKPKEGPDRVGIGLSAAGGDSEINPKVYDGRTWLTVHVEFGVPTGNEPRRVYNLVLDTGSSDLWVVANGCQNCSWTGAGAPGGYDLSKKAGTELVPAELGYGSQY